MNDELNKDGIIPDSSDSETLAENPVTPEQNPPDDTVTEEQQNETVSLEESNPLDSELNEIAQLFQTALDNDGEITGSQETPENSDEDLCKCCGVNPRDVSEDEDNPYCEHCMTLMKNRSFGFRPILVILLMLVVSVAAAYLSLDKLDSYMTALSADSSLFSAKKYDALNSYNSYFSSLSQPEDAGNLVAMRAAKAFASLGYYSDAATIVDTYFTDAELKNPIFSSMKALKTDFDEFNGTYNYINTMLSTLDADGTANGDKLIEAIEALRGVDPKLANSEAAFTKYDEFVIDYYKYMVAVNSDKSMEEQRTLLEAMAEKYPGKLWAYGANLCNICVRMGDAESAKLYYEKVKSFNANDVTVDAYYANLYRFGKERNANKMLEILNPAIEVEASSELYRMAAIAYLMLGDNETAFTNAYTAYTNAAYSGYTFQMLYTVALCALLTDNTDVYNTVEGMLQSNGYEMSEEIVGYQNGTFTVDDIIYNAEGDLA